MRIVDRHSQRKLYLQLVEIVQEAIDHGELAVGAQLPTEDQMCIQQDVSKAVVRTAMQELAKKGYVKKIPGRGTFVQKPVETKGIWLSSLLTENLLDFGLSWETEVVQKMLTVSPTDMNELFAMETGHQVFKVTRLRFVEEVPAALETAYVSHDLCPGLLLEDMRSTSLLEILTQKYGLRILRSADSIEATTLEDREAELLKKKKGETAILADRILYTANNRVAAFIRVLSVSQKHRITFECFLEPGR